MRILYYNWVPFDEEKGVGRGVSVYLDTLIREIKRYHPGTEVYFLSCGYHYDVKDRSLRYVEIENKYGELCKSYTVLNSPIVSPAYLSFFHLEKIFADESLSELFKTFLKEQGPFDIVHYHNIEGLSLSALRISNQFPNTRFIYTAHNYYSVCPQVNLWKQERECCMQPDTDEKCIGCMMEHVPMEKLRRKKALTYDLLMNFDEDKKKKYEIEAEEINREFYEEEHRELTDEEKDRLTKRLKKYRGTMTSVINANISCVIGVSKRTCRILEKNGIKNDKIRQLYIGTSAADEEMKPIRVSDKKRIAVVYMGYQMRDKGYYFFIEAMNRLPEEIANRIDLTVAAKYNPKQRGEEIRSEKFASYTYKDGYKRDEVKEILADKDLGVVPVLWEDNLPQVAMEIAASGVPVLASDRGGASELSDDERFRFKAGDKEDFAEHISYFVNNPEALNGYWGNFNGLTTMREHIESLFRIYEEE